MRICFIGESFVNGYGDPEYLGWPGRVCAATSARGHDVTCYNLGIRRNTSHDVAARWRDEAVRRLPPDEDGRLVFSFGANDTGMEEGHRRVEDADSLRNFRSILGEAATTFPVLMVGPPPVVDAAQNARIAHLSAEFQLAGGEISVPYLDVFTHLSASVTWAREVAQGDGAHPGAGGYWELASLVEAWPAWQAWFEGVH